MGCSSALPTMSQQAISNPLMTPINVTSGRSVKPEP
jgi:hypothetical protein